ncbi:hypothetical protein DYB35_001915 [Aphanomyces astaci]|uniref:FZ domain-containing protein n=1 Tax=Aphanomyces astaci TaxID=112090 RepID=A0A418DGU2_APHAT|nr:hypothetical protein DYB35_001915 [Aphanomyces astaci]
MNFGTATDVPLFRHLTLDMSGLKEHEVRELLLHHDPTASSLSSKDGVVHYRSQFDVPRDPEDDKIEDPLTRQAKYIAGLQQRVAAASQVPVPTAVGRRRQHHRKNDINTTKLGTLDPHQIPTTTTPPEESSADPPHLPRLATAARPPTKVLGSHRRLADKATDDVFCVEDLEAALRTHLPSPTRYSAKLAPGIVPQTVSTLVLGGDMRNTPKSLKRAKLMPQIVDQYHRDATRQAKRHVITEHMDRINAYAAEADYKAKLMAENHIKATSTKLLHYHQTFYASQSQQALKNHEKGLIHSDVAKHNHNASLESMFSPGFCGSLRNHYPVCLQRSMTVALQDRLAESQYALFHAASVSATNNSTPSCHQALREVACTFAFPACELAQARPLCSSMCALQVANNCSASFASQAQPVTNNVCGTVDDSKCIPWTYTGPNRGAWVAGFTISVVFSFLSSIGINLQKKALKQNEVTAHETGTQPMSPFRLPLWTLGFCLIVAGSLLDFIAFGLAPQSLLAPLAALTLVWNMVRPTQRIFVTLGGLMGGQSVLFAKSTVELVKSLLAGGDCFTHPETYCIIVAMGGCLVAQMHFLNGGLANYDALSVVPIYQAYWIISGVMGGAVYFQEIRSFSEFQACMFVLGILTTIGGVALLAQRSLLSPPPLLKKRKTLASRNLSSYWHTPQALVKSVAGPDEPVVTVAVVVEAKPGGASGSRGTSAEVDLDEADEEEDEVPGLGQDSSDEDATGAASSAPTSIGVDDDVDNEDMNSMNRQAIENSLDMSPMGTFLMGFPSQRNLSIFLRRESSNRLASAVLRPNNPLRTAQDDFEIGLPTSGTGSSSSAALAPDDSTDTDDKRKAKRRSITFAGFKSSKK